MNSQGKRSLLAVAAALLLAAGLAWAGNQGGVQFNGYPLFAAMIALIFLIQWIVFIPSFIQQTEHYFDLTGSMTYISVTLIALALSPLDARALLLGALVIIWAIRLGSFLFLRVRAAGEDRRFRELKSSFGRFLVTWTLQGLWVALTLGAALAAITAVEKVQLGATAAVGFSVWLAGFALEVLADRQKRQFRAKAENKGKFIQSGLWSWSRHPNYFGEVVLWLGVAIIAFPALSGWQYLTLISPLFVLLLITRVSGVNMLEEAADAKWGGQKDYEDYKARTARFFPLPRKS